MRQSNTSVQLSMSPLWVCSVSFDKHCTVLKCFGMDIFSTPSYATHWHLDLWQTKTNGLKSLQNNLPKQTWWMLNREKYAKSVTKNQGQQTEQGSSATCDGSAAPACLKQLRISDSRCLGGKCFRCATRRLRHSAFVLTHQVDVTIVTPRQINLWRLKGRRKSKPLFRRWSLLLLSKPCFYLHLYANTRSWG